jgi:Flp pilus assembly protein TadG
MAARVVSPGTAARLRDERGQAVVITAVFLVALLGMAALAVDLGAWSRSQRALQARVDAAALAGAQALPYDTDTATSLAGEYASKNGGQVAGQSITIGTTTNPNDTIEVTANNQSQGFFAKTFGIQSVTVRARATAVANLIGSARYVAPIAVNIQHPYLSGMVNGTACPCFMQDTTLPLGKTGAPGAFALLNLDGAHGGNGGQNTLADWIINGYNEDLDLGEYFSNTGAKFDAVEIQNALGQRVANNSTLLFPVFDVLNSGGANAMYHVIGWVGFTLTGYGVQGNDGYISGHFTEVVWSGLASTPGSGQPDLGARTIRLTG